MTNGLQSDCLTLPETLEEIFDTPGHEMAYSYRRKVTDCVLTIDGERGKGTTCIAEKDLPRLRDAISTGMESGEITDEWAFAFRNRLRGLIHSMNKNCDGCCRIGCKSRPPYDQEKRANDEPVSSRGSKLRLELVAG